MSSEKTTTPKPGMSLYANLLDTPEGASISRAPVVFKQATDAPQDDPAMKKQQISAASLRFQPTKRPQLPSQRLKAKSGISKPPVITSSASPATPDQGTTSGAVTAGRPTGKSTIADWTATADDDDVNGYYGGEKRQRGGRKKRKKNYESEVIIQNWDDIYDPTRPNSYEAYKHSDEKIREVREWKDRLYAHRLAQQYNSDEDSDEERSRPQMNRQFAPPSSFAPPPNLNAPPEESPEPQRTFSEAVPQPAVEIPDDSTGEEAYARRLRLSANINQPEPPPQPSQPSQLSQPSPTNEAPESTAPASHNYSAATISRPPVRYALPAAPGDLPATEAELEETLANEQEDANKEGDEDAPRSLRPGQKGFAERLLTKYGWTKGSGLGANESGIVNPLQVKVQKQKKKPDSEGRGVAPPGGPRGKIVGGGRKQEEQGKFGPMSDVVILHGMVDGLDLDAELESGELMQEIGDECGEKYGRVERVYIDRNSKDRIPVFIKFTNQLSALRAVNALEGRIFNGNTITARFFDSEKFEEGIYD
ncbi:TPA_exp: putative G-patch DNA repair protein (Drt111) [Trichophyton benhamiae CBS 112371]|nr:TPA_exp: putative G-patch DNA repair protein (Drt111) [Trichophyton benhamiae CBS 112371]